MKYLVITLRNPDFDPDVVLAHYQFLSDLRDRGLLEQAGPFTDRTGGAYVLNAASLQEATLLAHQDPLHLRRCSALTIHEWDSE
jgi:uncharacterized protein YciI